MSSNSGDLAGTGNIAHAGSLSEADRALLLAMRAWSVETRPKPESATENENEQEFISRFEGRLEPGWVRRLCGTSERHEQSGDRLDSNGALSRLRRMHASSVRVELEQVHPTWLVRALQEESPAVKRLVAASVPESLTNALQAGLLLDSQDLMTERPVQPIFREWVMGLWTERLVGGERARDDDLPALAVLCRLSARAGYRLCRMAGVAKLTVALEKPEEGRTNQIERLRDEWFHGRFDPLDPEFQTRARGDALLIARMKLPRRLHAARLGLVTLARLLADSEPFRLRWALQHWPYPIVKLTRSLMSDPSSRTPGVLRGESQLLKSAWERLTLEGRLREPWPDRGGDKEVRPS
jgi:hypothetical protein